MPGSTSSEVNLMAGLAVRVLARRPGLNPSDATDWLSDFEQFFNLSVLHFPHFYKGILSIFQTGLLMIK